MSLDRTWIITGFDGSESRRPDPPRFADWSRLPGRDLARHRSGEAVRVAAGDSPFGFAIVRKSHRYPTLRSRWRGVLRNTFLATSRVLREARNLGRLARLGLQPLLALAVGEQRVLGVLRDSFLLTRYVPARPLDEVLAGPLEPARRRRLLETLGSFAGRLHRAGYVDRDLHLRNVLEDDDGALVKVDCPRGSFPPAAWRWLSLRRDRRDLFGEVQQVLGRVAAARVRRAYRISAGSSGAPACRG